MLHSLGLDGFSFDWLARQMLERARVRIVALDMQGHGFFNGGAAEISLPGMAADVIRRLERLRIRKAHLLGTSMGSAIARFAVMQDPGRWESLTLVAGGPAAVPAVAARGQAAMAQGMASIIPSTLERWFSQTEIDANPDYVAYARAALGSMAPESWQASWQALAGYPMASRIPPELPGRCMAGEHDASTPPTVVDQMRIHAGITAPVSIVKGAHHQLLMSKAAASADLLAESLHL
jgi:pimeloyl-ACP methyl ester carboxylesterase